MTDEIKTTTEVGGVDSGRLTSYFDRIERLEEEVKGLRGDIREIFAEAKGNGFDPKVMRKVLQLRRMNPADRAESEFLLDAYKQALGME